MRRLPHCLAIILLLGLCLPVRGWAKAPDGIPCEETAPAATAAPEEGKGKAEAQEEGCPATFGPIITDTAVPMEKGKFQVQPTFGLGFVNNTLTRSWRRASAGGNYKTFSMNYKFTYGLIKNVEIYTVIPYLHDYANSVSTPAPNGERSADFGGLGDVSFTLKYQVVEESQTLPTVSAILTPTFPTGHCRHLNPGRLDMDLLGGGGYGFTTGFNMSKYVKPFIFYANVWYTMQTAYTCKEERVHLVPDVTGELVEGPAESTNLRNYPRDYVSINLAAEYLITKHWIALVELTSYWDGGRLVGQKANLPAGTLLSVMPGIEYMATDRLGFALGVNCNLVGKNGSASITPQFSCQYQF